MPTGTTDELIDMRTLEEVAPVIRNAAHPLRLRILDFLRLEGGPRTVTEITEAGGASQAVISQQLRILKDQGIVTARREGNHVLYDVANRNVLLLLECIRRHKEGGCV
ncbi:MAG: helix-turn-helix transcriptional regulator [Chthonomonadales bacterium]|nr:helix-turn-helix transcriptional regulator [Chthonomonadales bacterium]